MNVSSARTFAARTRLFAAASVAVAFVLGSTALRAQGPGLPPDPGPRGTFGIPGVRISGSTEITGEAYGASGIDNRRPGSSWRVAMRPTITLFGELSASMDLLLTNEGNEYRQNGSIDPVAAAATGGALVDGHRGQGALRRRA